MKALAHAALLGILLSGCGSESAPTASTGPTAPPLPSSSAPSAAPGRIVHEAQLVADPRLRVDFSQQVVVDHLDATLDADLIPFRSAIAGPQNFNLATSQVSRAELLDAAGNTLALLQPGDNTVNLPAGDLRLKLTSAGLQETLLGIGVPVQPAIRPLVQPGIYIQELTSFPLVQPAATAVTLFVGAGRPGPPQTVTSFTQYAAQNGQAPTPLTLAVYQFFQNGGQIALVQPVAEASPAALNTALQAVSWLDFNLLILPDLRLLSSDQADAVTLNALNLATAHKAMLLTDLPDNLDTPIQVQSWLQGHPQFQQPQAAAYWPSLQITAPDGSIQTIGPSSSMAGIFASTDSRAGVWLNPAGPAFPLQNVQSLSQAAAPFEGVNVLIDQSPSIVCYGDRTLNRQMIARQRLQNYLELSLTQSLQWVVFEPAGPSLFATITSQLTQFMSFLWQIGGLSGDTASQAFQVECSLLNNPVDTRELSMVNIDLSYAPESPGQLQLLTISILSAPP